MRTFFTIQPVDG